jgi:5'-nucleotidase
MPSARHVRARLASLAGLAGLGVIGLVTVGLAACSSDAAAPAGGPADTGTADVDPGDGGDGGDGGSNVVQVQVLAINDFHGNLEAPTGTSGVLVAHPDDPSLVGHDAGPIGAAGNGEITIRAGGASFLATRIRSLRAENPQTVVVSAGDLSGASPLLSGLFHDEPSVLAMNALGLDLNAVGNHEFDHGAAELLRLQNGGCHPTDGCTKVQPVFPGATFHYLAANVNTALKQTLFRPYEVKTFDGEKVAFIGMTLEDTPGIVTASAVAGLTFANEVATVNALLPELKMQGVAGIVVLVHQGGVQDLGTTYDACGVRGGVIAAMAAQLDPAVDVVVSAHTHQPYVCQLGGKLVTSASSFGRVVTKIDLTIDKTTHRITTKSARNLPVTRDVVPDPEVASIVSTYQALSAPLANRVVGHITADLPVAAVDLSIGESLLGDVIADAQLAATSGVGGPGAVAAFMNGGGIRADLLFAQGGKHPDGEVSYGEAFSVQPFTNLLVTMTITGAQLKEALEAQFAFSPPYPLQPSSSVSYTFKASGTFGNHIDPAEVFIGGVALDLAASYRITVNNYLAGGGDGFTVFTKGTSVVTGGIDVDALVTYLGSHDPLVQPTGGRIKKKP